MEQVELEVRGQRRCVFVLKYLTSSCYALALYGGALKQVELEVRGQIAGRASTSGRCVFVLKYLANSFA